MKLNLIAVGTKPPEWVKTGFEEYNKRLPREYKIQLNQIAAEKRSKAKAVPQLVEKEGLKMLDLINGGTRVIALDVKGVQWTTHQLAEKMDGWNMDSENIVFMVGGADGLSTACRERANLCWSLSNLTFPHFLVRVLIAEQVYRGWSLLNNHPYHR